MKILVLAGGSSNEHAISLLSGDNVEQALKACRYAVRRADPAEPGFELAEAVHGVDLVFPMLHGEGGEDGVIQAELEQLEVPFVGSGSKACELTYDKTEFKRLLESHKIATPAWEVVTPQSFTATPLAGRPFVLKPITGGSSIDTFIVRDPQELPTRLPATLERYGEMLLEELVPGQEVTVGVIGEQALPLILIVPPEGQEFDYENKYNGKSQEIVEPDEVPEAVQQEAQKLALHIHRLSGCRHISRSDFIIQADGSLSVLELNTLPGMTAESLVPKAAAAAGLAMPALVKYLVELTQ